MRFAWIHVEKATHAVRRLCRVLAVTPSGYYAWMHRLPSQRERDNDRLQVHIRAIHAASRGTYGSPRVHEQLTHEGCAVGRERVARLLRDMGLVGLPARRVRHTTDSTHGRPVAPNVLARHFEADQPNQRWTTDITFIWTWEGWLYLAVVLDLYARRVVGWAVQPHLRTELALEALQLALGRRVPAPGLVHHSDRGCQYAAEAYQRVLREHGIVCSMSRTGDCWDNAVTESFFATLKTALIHRQPWPTRRAATDAVADYIEGFYNPYRLHSSLGYLSPNEFERVVSRVPWKSSGVASAELGYLSRLRVVKPERRGVIAFREAARPFGGGSHSMADLDIVAPRRSYALSFCAPRPQSGIPPVCDSIASLMLRSSPSSASVATWRWPSILWNRICSKATSPYSSVTPACSPERCLRLRPTTELPIQVFQRVGRTQRAPHRLGERVERQ